MPRGAGRVGPKSFGGKGLGQLLFSRNKKTPPGERQPDGAPHIPTYAINARANFSALRTA